MVHPPHAEKQAAAALKWALMSTYTATPTLTAFVTGAHPAAAGIQRLLEHNRVLHLHTYPKNNPGGPVLTRGDGWKMLNTDSVRGDVAIFLIANPEGLTLLNRAALAPLAAALRTPIDLNQKIAAWAICLNAEAGAREAVGRSHEEMELAPPRAFRNATVPTQPLHIGMNAHEQTAFIAQLPTARQLCITGPCVYTDGSLTRNVASAGVYFPATNQTHHVRLNGHDATLNTVTRAEAAGLLHALQHTPPASDMTFMIDSQVLLHQITTMLTLIIALRTVYPTAQTRNPHPTAQNTQNTASAARQEPDLAFARAHLPHLDPN